jgi:protein-S-isoprenylcysteine O-methyltransferase Ste14
VGQNGKARDAGMMILAKIIYWLLSIVAALLLVLTAVYLVETAYHGQETPDWWLHALSLALLAVCIWFAGWVFRYFVRRIWGLTTAQ